MTMPQEKNKTPGIAPDSSLSTQPSCAVQVRSIFPSFFAFLYHWLDVAVKTLAIMAAVVAYCSIRFPEVQIKRRSALSVVDQNAVFNSLKERNVPELDKLRSDLLGDHAYASHIYWYSEKDDASKYSKCNEMPSKVPADQKAMIDRINREHEDLVRMKAGYSKNTRSEYMSKIEDCAPYSLFPLNSFLTSVYGEQPLLRMLARSDHADFQEFEPYAKIDSIKDDQTRLKMLESLSEHRRVLTILNINNDGDTEARDVRIMFNFALNTVQAVQNSAMSSDNPKWEIIELPVVQEGGETRLSRPHHAEISYKVLPRHSRKWIFIITDGSGLEPDSYHVEPPTYFSTETLKHLRAWIFLPILLSLLIAFHRFKTDSRKATS